ncbi:MAG: hypothetical protein QXZ70_08590 [Candidatus Bathyarchaeia archaeon]
MGTTVLIFFEAIGKTFKLSRTTTKIPTIKEIFSRYRYPTTMLLLVEKEIVSR